MHLRDALGGGWEGMADGEMSMISFGTAIAVNTEAVYMHVT